MVECRWPSSRQDTHDDGTPGILNLEHVDLLPGMVDEGRTSVVFLLTALIHHSTRKHHMTQLSDSFQRSSFLSNTVSSRKK